MPVDLLLLALVVPAGLWDLRTGRIPNWLTYPALLAGLVCSWWGLGPGLASSGLAVSLAGGLFVWFYFEGWVGAGDAKLVGAVGAIKGLDFTLSAVMCASAIGGALALLILARERRLGAFLVSFLPLTWRAHLRTRPDEGGVRALPLGTIIGAASLLVLIWSRQPSWRPAVLGPSGWWLP